MAHAAAWCSLDAVEQRLNRSNPLGPGLDTPRRNKSSLAGKRVLKLGSWAELSTRTSSHEGDAGALVAVQEDTASIW